MSGYVGTVPEMDAAQAFTWIEQYLRKKVAGIGDAINDINRKSNLQVVDCCW